MSARRQFAAVSEAVASVRRFVGDALVGQGCTADECEMAALCVSELATNVVLHGTGPMKIVVSRDERVRVEVADCDRHSPVLRLTGPEDEGGRGLQLVALLSTRWGHEITDHGKTVWFEMDCVPV